MFKNKIRGFLLIIIALLFLFQEKIIFSEEFSKTSECSSLPGEKKELAEKIMNSNYLYDCCDGTISSCLKEKKKCKLAYRLKEQVCKMVSKGKSQEEIESELMRRAKSMMPKAKTYNIDTSGIDTWAGDKNSKVVLVAYVCARCPFCAKIIPKVYKAVTEGKLKGKVKVYVKIFPIKSHPGSAEGGFALASAGKLGKFWQLLLKLYEKFDKFKVENLPDLAVEAGLDKEKFKEEMNKAETKNIVVESKKEGLRNEVEGTPTFFINGKKYRADQSIESIIDVLEEEYDRVTGNIYM